MAITGGIQPAVVDSLRNREGRGVSALDDGFLDRYLFNYPVELPAVGEQWRDVSPEAAAAWTQAVERLLQLGLVGEPNGPSVAGSVFAGHAGDDKVRPFVLRLSPEGRQAWKRFTDRHAAEMNAEDCPAHLLGPWGKLYGYCGRLALILHCLQWAQSTVEPVYAVDPVDGESLEAASRLIAYFKSHARKLYAALDADPRIAEARKVLRCLVTNPELATFTRRDLDQHLRRQFKKPEALDAPLKLLVEYGYLRCTTAERGHKTGPTPERYEVNSDWLTQMRTHRTQRTQVSGSEGEPVYAVYGVYASEEEGDGHSDAWEG